MHLHPLILAAFAWVWPWKSLQKDFEFPLKPGTILASGKFGSLSNATCNKESCQILWLRDSADSVLESVYNSIPKDGGELGLTISKEDGYFVGFIDNWFSTSPPSQDRISKKKLKRIHKKAMRDVLGVQSVV